ncbi:hypothetical protein [Haloplanus sp.]|nr:hypothetical protein [Haloplanus sp.]
MDITAAAKRFDPATNRFFRAGVSNKRTGSIRAADKNPVYGNA